MNKITFLLLSILYSAITSCYNPTSLEQKLQAVLDSTLQKHPEAVGIMLHIEATDKGISWSGAAGYSDKDTKVALEVDQPGQIGSITKTFVATTIFRLIELGKLKLDQPISEVLHERTLNLMKENGYATDSITIGHLLSHKSGISDITTVKWKEKEKNDLQYRWSRDEQLKDAITMQKKEKPGFEWKYSDVNYLLLSEIIEQLTGTSFYLAMRDLLSFDELGLKNTWFYTLEKDPPETKSRVHQYKENRDWVSTYDESPTWGLYGPAGLVSTPQDLVTFSQALFGGKIYKQKQTLDLMLSDIKTTNGIDVEEILKDTIQYNYLMGLEEITTTGIHFIGHGGYWGTWMAYFPKENIHAGLFVLNADEMEKFEMKLMREILDIVEEN